MFHKKTKHLIGKTIKSINTRAVNVWKIKFTDGTTEEVWAELFDSNGIAGLFLDNKKPYPKTAK